MHSSAKSPSLPGESRDEKADPRSDGGFTGVEPPQTRTHPGITHAHSCCTLFLHLTVSFIVLSVRMFFLAPLHSRDSLFPEWVTHTQACKAQLIDLLGFRG